MAERHAYEIAGSLTIYHGILTQGTFPGSFDAEGMTAYRKAGQMRMKQMSWRGRSLISASKNWHGSFLPRTATSSPGQIWTSFLILGEYLPGQAQMQASLIQPHEKKGPRYRSSPQDEGLGGP